MKVFQPKEKTTTNNDVFQNEVSNASSSHVERIVVHDPSFFFIDLRMFENDHSMNYNDEDGDEDVDEDEDEDEKCDDDELI